MQVQVKKQNKQVSEMPRRNKARVYPVFIYVVPPDSVVCPRRVAGRVYMHAKVSSYNMKRSGIFKTWHGRTGICESKR